MNALAGWRTRPRPERRVLEGAYCRLEPIDPARHGDALFAASMAEGAASRHRYLFEAPMPRDAFDAWLKTRVASEDPLMFAVIDAVSGKAEGRQCLMRIEPAHGVIEIGSILWGPAMARRRIATEALFLTARYVFDDLGYRRFEWKCNDLNSPSKRAAERFGFRFEGVFHQHMVAKGENRDTAWFAMTDADWPSLRAGYESWLDPANFYANATQKSALSAHLAASRIMMAKAPLAAGLRRGAPEDLAALVALQEAAYAANAKISGRRPYPLTWDYEKVLADWECWLLDASDRPGALDGAILLQAFHDHLCLESIAVHPDAQAKKLGRRLLEVTEARARERGFTHLRLITNGKLSRNVDWYLAKGFMIDRIERLEDREIAHFVKRLEEIPTWRAG